MNTVPVSIRSPMSIAAASSRRPDRGGQPVGAVVHQGDCFIVAGHFHDAGDRPEGLFRHHRHLVVDPGQHLGCEIGPLAGIGWKRIG